MSMKDYYSETIRTLNEVSHSYCLAKWKHVTLHLHAGTTQSCHHPRPHPIPVDGLRNDPRLLHNTPRKIRARQEMLSGIRPSECNYCWIVEDSSGDGLSDRIVKSASPWAQGTSVEILKDPLGRHFNPAYLEVSFSSLCNLKCVYCGPHFSSSWANELERFGEISGFRMDVNSIADDGNPYIDAFWRWWPELRSSLRVLRLTGGEPFLSEAVIRLLKEMEAGDPLNLKLIINSNLAVPEAKFKEVLALLQAIVGKVQGIEIVSSMESSGKKAEYIRHGLRINRFWENVEELRRRNFCDLSITATVNVLSVGSFLSFYEDVAKVKLRGRAVSRHRFFVDPSFLKAPDFLSVLSFPADVKRALRREIDGVLCRAEEFKMHKYETMRLGILDETLVKTLDNVNAEAVARLVPFLSDIDRRRDLNHRETFPELFSLLDQS